MLCIKNYDYKIPKLMRSPTIVFTKYLKIKLKVNMKSQKSFQSLGWLKIMKVTTAPSRSLRVSGVSSPWFDPCPSGRLILIAKQHNLPQYSDVSCEAKQNDEVQAFCEPAPAGV